MNEEEPFNMWDNESMSEGEAETFGERVSKSLFGSSEEDDSDEESRSYVGR